MRGQDKAYFVNQSKYSLGLSRAKIAIAWARALRAITQLLITLVVVLTGDT
ncbi:MAG: hypothetical protein V7L13_31130 [Nostoc sp.]|uniref:hypothetical protein n=1 Tax=Nostoc sp. TaxID=1180 RepID=UPI002FF5A235